MKLSIAKNECNLWLRRQARNQVLSLDDIGDIAANEVDAFDAVDELLDGLPQESTQVLRMYYLQDKNISEIAKELSIPDGTVKSRLFTARKRIRSCYPNNSICMKKGKSDMNEIEKFPKIMPELLIEKTNLPFFEVRCEEDSFIIPKIGNKSSEATYRYPQRKLALVSVLNVSRAAFVDEVEGVMICRDTYVVAKNKYNKNEKVWISQLTDEYIRNLATISDMEGDAPVHIDTFLDESYDVIVNGNDRIHGMPLRITENSAEEIGDELVLGCPNVRYTMGVWRVSIGGRTYETVKCVMLQSAFSEWYFDRNGRVVLLRWYEPLAGVENDEYYSTQERREMAGNMRVKVNGIEYVHTEDRFSDYVL